MNEENSENKGKLVGTVSLVVMSLISALIGAAMLFVPNMSAKIICYILCGGLIVWGIVQFSRFFATEAYHKLHDYSFSSGALLVILGCCGLARASEISQNLETYFGLLVLIMGVLMLQSAVQLKASKGKTWALQLVVSILGLIAAVLVLAGLKNITSLIPNFTYWSLLLLGILNAISFLTVGLRVKKYQKQKAVEELVIDAAKHIGEEDAIPIETVEDVEFVEEKNQADETNQEPKEGSQKENLNQESDDFEEVKIPKF